MASAIIKNSNFINNRAKSGAALCAASEQTAIYLLDNNNFTGNMAQERGGGAVSISQNGYLYCQNSHFGHNTAELNAGGAIFINSSTSNYLKYYFDNCCFESNKAKYGGKKLLFNIIL